MAVYERTYKRYPGPFTSQAKRFLVIPRYALRDVFSSRLFLAFFVLCLLPPLVWAAAIYLRNNAAFLEAYDMVVEVFTIDNAAFFLFLRMQGWLALFLTLIVGPGLISRDLANNGLPLYLSRPFSRPEYVFGKLSVLGILLSAVTWVPGILLYLLQASLAGEGWGIEHLRWAGALVVGALVWILVLSLLAMALSAWVRWRMVAGFVMLVLVFSGYFFAFMINQLFDTRMGELIILPRMTWNVWTHLFGLEPVSRVPVTASWVALAALVGIALLLLRSKLKAYQVVG